MVLASRLLRWVLSGTTVQSRSHLNSTSALFSAAVLFAALYPSPASILVRRCVSSRSNKFESRQPTGSAKAPAVIFWAWERPEDFRLLDPNQAGVAFLARSIYIITTQLSAPGAIQASQFRSFVVRRASSPSASRPVLSSSPSFESKRSQTHTSKPRFWVAPIPRRVFTIPPLCSNLSHQKFPSCNPYPASPPSKSISTLPPASTPSTPPFSRACAENCLLLCRCRSLRSPPGA